MTFNIWKHFSKAVLALILLSPGAFAQEVVTLVYHRFGEDTIPATNIRIDQFEAQLDYLMTANAHFPKLEDVVKALKTKTPLPDRSILFTVDDAYRSAAIEAWPRLKARGIPLTIFVSTQAVDDNIPGYLSWDELRSLQKQGVTIGFHSHSHRHLAFESMDSIVKDLSIGIQRFTEEMGMPSPYFAYPYGEYSEALKAEVVASGFDAAFAQFSSVTGPASDIFALPRFAINASYGDLNRFKLITNARHVQAQLLSPQDPLIDGQKEPDHIRFQLDINDRGWRNIACYPSHLGKAASLSLSNDGIIDIELERALPKGRSRINCTYLGTDNRWRWFGLPFFKSGNFD